MSDLKFSDISKLNQAMYTVSMSMETTDDRQAGYLVL